MKKIINWFKSVWQKLRQKFLSATLKVWAWLKRIYSVFKVDFVSTGMFLVFVAVTILAGTTDIHASSIALIGAIFTLRAIFWQAQYVARVRDLENKILELNGQKGRK